MSLNKKAIETISVNAVRDSVVMSNFLDQFIADNDKEPSWDGFVYIYDDRSKRKENLKGRLPVQIKGKICDDLSNSEISYPMSTIDLRNYLYDGGVVLFVVYIGNEGLTRKIYYAELPPIKLRLTLAQAKQQKIKTIKLKEFPNDNNKKATIFFNCLQNCQKQASFTEAKLLSLEELEKQGLLEGITVPFSGVGLNDPQLALIANEVYIYANVKGSVIPQPIEMIPLHMQTVQEQSVDITIGDKQFYSIIKLIKSSDGIKYTFGESFSIRFLVENSSTKINYKNSSHVRVLANDLHFMMSYIDAGYFNFNGVKLPFDRNEADFSNFNIEEQKERLEFAQRAVQTLDILGCKEDVDLAKLNNEGFRNLNRLINAFVDKKPVKGFKKDIPLVQNVIIDNLKFTLCFHLCEGTDDTCELYDFFKTELSVAYNGKDDKKLPISQYAILSAKDLLSINNIRFDVLLPSFQKCKKHYDTYNRANWFLPELLTAYDKSGGKRKEILKTAHDFADWIMQANEEELSYQIKLINYLQVIKREREFNISEIKDLYSLIQCDTTREDVIVGAYLLLSNQVAAQIHFDKLTAEEQESFQTFPIYHFWTELNDYGGVVVEK